MVLPFFFYTPQPLPLEVLKRTGSIGVSKYGKEQARTPPTNTACRAIIETPHYIREESA